MDQSGMNIGSNQATRKKGRKLYWHTDVIIPNPRWPRELCVSLTDKQRERFEADFGKVTRLPFMMVDTPFIQAVVPFWNNLFHCFTFGEFDLAPTIEEYERLMGFPYHTRKGIYWPREIKITFDQLAQWTGYDKNSIQKAYRNSGFSMAQLKAMYDTVKERFGKDSMQEVNCRMVTLAFFIYGLYILPTYQDFIHFEVVQLVWQVQHDKENPANAILAETYAALSKNAAGNGRALRCSSHLLQIWLNSHLLKPEFLPIGLKSIACHDIIANSIEFSLSHKGLGEIRNELLKLKEVNWRAPWLAMFPVKYELTMGGRKVITLIGPWHFVDFAPLILARQHGDKQRNPRDLDRCDYLHDFDPAVDFDLIKQFQFEWNTDLEMAKSEGKLLGTAPQYDYWRKNTTGRFPAPPLWTEKELGNKRPRQDEVSQKTIRLQQTETIQALNMQIEQLMVENYNLKQGHFDEEEELKRALRNTEGKLYEARQRLIDMTEYQKSQSKISDQLQWDNDELSGRVVALQREADISQQKLVILEEETKVLQQNEVNLLGKLKVMETNVSNLQKKNKAIQKMWEQTAKQSDEMVAYETARADQWFQEWEEENKRRINLEQQVECLRIRFQNLAEWYQKRDQNFQHGGELALAKVKNAYFKIQEMEPWVYAKGGAEVCKGWMGATKDLAECIDLSQMLQVNARIGESPREEQYRLIPYEGSSSGGGQDNINQLRKEEDYLGTIEDMDPMEDEEQYAFIMRLDEDLEELAKEDM